MCIKICLTTFWKQYSRKLFTCLFTTRENNHRDVTYVQTTNPNGFRQDTDIKILNTYKIITWELNDCNFCDEICVDIWKVTCASEFFHFNVNELIQLLCLLLENKLTAKKRFIFCPVPKSSVCLWREEEERWGRHNFEHLCHVTCKTRAASSYDRTSVGFDDCSLRCSSTESVSQGGGFQRDVQLQVSSQLFNYHLRFRSVSWISQHVCRALTYRVRRFYIETKTTFWCTA